MLYLIIFLSISFGQQCMFQNIQSSSFIFQDEKVELRKTLDEVTQAKIVRNSENHLYHSYIFKSGVGNREELQMDSIVRDVQFPAGIGVKSWQSVQSADQVFLLGRRQASVSLLVTHSQLLSNRSARFSEHSLDLGSTVTSTTILSSWNAALSREEVIVSVALNSSAGDIFWYRVVTNKLVNITRWSRYKQTSSMAAIKGVGKTQLVIVDASSPATVDIFDVIFTHDGSNLDLRLVQSFPLESKCSSITVCKVAKQVYLMFIQPSLQLVAVHRQHTATNTSFFEGYSTLSFPQVSQVISFNLASQLYLAFNGEHGHVFRLTDSGHFVEELSLGPVTEWLAVPVSSYRSDVVLFSQNDNNTRAFIWGGTNKGFIPSTMPSCDNCLEGDWSGAVSIQLGRRNCLLLPRAGETSSLVTITTSLHNIKNPVKEYIESVKRSMQQYQVRLNYIQLKLLEAEESLRHVIKVNGENIITAKWNMSKVSAMRVIFSSLFNGKSELTNSREPINIGKVDVSTLYNLVEETVRSANSLKKEVWLKEKEIWGLDNFSGKLSLKGRFVVDNLTIGKLNHNSMDEVLQNTYRKDKPQTIQTKTVIESLQAEDLYFDKVKNLTSESVKFSDEPVVIKGNVTFLNALDVDGAVSLDDGGRVNGVNISEQLCDGEEHCAVFPRFEIESRVEDPDTSSKRKIVNIRQLMWDRVIGGKNITVIKVNGMDWEKLTKNVVFTDVYQQIPGTTVIKGTLSSDKTVWTGSVGENYNPQQRDADKPSSISAAPIKKKPASADRKIDEAVLPINPYSDVIFTNLEVTGSITCDESDWGASASDVILSSADPIHVFSDKIFKSDVNVDKNMEVKGLVGGVNVSELLTSDTTQTFTDLTSLHGNVTVGHVTLTGYWNGMNITGTSRGGGFSLDANSMREVSANQVIVTETVNGVHVAELVFSDSNGVTSVTEMILQYLNVTSHIDVFGKVCNQDLQDYEARRFSIQKEQTVRGNFVVGNFTSRTFDVGKMNGRDIDMTHILEHPSSGSEIHLSALHVDGNITTGFGLNGFNVSQVAENAVMLLSNNIITGHLTFMDNVTIDWLECQGFFNQKDCQKSLDVSDVVYKTNGTKVFSGKKRFLNVLNILEDAYIEQINGHKVKSFLTKTTDQIIKGDVFVNGSVKLNEESTLEGLLNNQNLTKVASRCVLSHDTIKCTGDAEFKDSVAVDHFNCLGTINGLNFEHFAESLVDVLNPQPITGFKNFSGTTTVINLEVYKINDNIWDEFLVNAVIQDANGGVEGPVTFKEKVTAFGLSVNYDLDADSISGVDLNEWRSNAIRLNDTLLMKRPFHFSSVSSAGNITLVSYGHLNMAIDLVKLHSSSIMNHLSFESVTVLGSSDIGFTVNGRNLFEEEQKTLKVIGNQTILSDVVLSGDVSVFGNVTITGLVNHYNLSDVVTLDTDQNLHGNYHFECMEVAKNVTSTGLISSINMSEWVGSALVDQGHQDVTGTLTVLGDVEFNGPVQGKGRLGKVDLAQLKDNITRDILDVHRDLKANLTSVCQNTNHIISQARNQTSEFRFLDMSQEISVGGKISLVTSFKNNEGDFLTISDKKCTTTIYKWDKHKGSYIRLFSEVLGYEVSQLVALQFNQLTYLVSVSADLSMECYFSDKHIWLFTQNSIEHVSLVDLGSTHAIQAYNNRLYSVNSTGMFKWTMQVTDEGVNFRLDEMWEESTAGKKFIPEDPSLGLTFNDDSLESDFLLDAKVFNNCSGEIIIVSVSLTHQLIAAATSEKAQVPRYSDHVKIYHLNGSLFDKLPARQASHMHWFPVPGQTWLVFIQNNSSINLYHLRGVLEGFQLMFSAQMEDIENLLSVVLPSETKVNHQPYMIVQTVSSVKVIQAVLEGDPYLKPDVSCYFDDELHTINNL